MKESHLAGMIVQTACLVGNLRLEEPCLEDLEGEISNSEAEPLPYAPYPSLAEQPSPVASQ